MRASSVRGAVAVDMEILGVWLCGDSGIAVGGEARRGKA
jgi:hypothetical protein